MSTLEQVVVVGASAAGLGVVEALRRAGYELTALDLDLRLGTRATALDAASRKLTLADGTELDYDALIVATGVRPRRLPDTEDVAGLHHLRTLEDAAALRSSVDSGEPLVVIGGGFIGAEAAATARERGCEVTLVEMAPVLLAPALGDEIGGFLTDVHRGHGIRIEAGTAVDRLAVENGRAVGVRLADGRVIEAGAVLVGIGAQPNTEWLSDSGLTIGNGLECDATLYAGEGVWAAGDVASWPEQLSGERWRLEHRTNAAEQALAVARNVLAGPDHATPFTTVPYVWSDQYDLKIQIYGRTRGFDKVQIAEGNLADGAFTALYGRAGQVVAAVGVNMVRPLRALRKLVAERAPWDPALTTNHA